MLMSAQESQKRSKRRQKLDLNGSSIGEAEGFAIGEKQNSTDLGDTSSYNASNI